MATLAETRSSDRARPRNFVGKPKKVISGKPIKNVRPTSHRPEVLMDDQIEIVQDLQGQFEEAMISLLQAKSEQESSYWKKQVSDLKSKSEKHVLILKVVTKLNSELVYAKIKLRDTLKEGGDIVSARKRVVWLEERIGQISKKYFTDEFVDESESPFSSAPSTGRPTAQPLSASDEVTRPMRDTNRLAGGDAPTVLPGSAIPGESPKGSSKHGVIDLNNNSKVPWMEEMGPGGSYWQPSPYRFEFSEEFDAITNENPLSYHNLGLAVTSSFIEPALKTAPKLTQGEEEDKNEEIDSHDLAMVKISDRIDEILKKMEDAALASAEYKSPPTEGRQSKLLDCLSASRESTLEEGKRMVKQRRRSLQSPERPANNKEPASNRGITLPPVGAQITNPNTCSLKYYPKPVPSPEVLPVTRTNREKTFPRLCSEWNNTPPGEMKPTISLVNQIDIAKKTNLIARRKQMGRGESPPNKADRQPALITPTSEMSPRGGEDRGVPELADLVEARCRLGVRSLDKEGLKWERVEMMLSNLESGRVQERRDTARNLGDLDCCEPSVIDALTKRLEVDNDSRVKYESAKSVLSLGFWSPLPVNLLVKHLKSGTQSVKLDVLQTITAARNADNVDRSLPAIQELISTLRGICVHPSTEKDLAYRGAVCLGRLGVKDHGAKQELLDSLDSNDSHVIAPALEILVRLYYTSDAGVVEFIVRQLDYSPVWKHRASAAKLLAVLGPECFHGSDMMERIQEILKRQLYDDPSQEVRTQVASTLTALGMRNWIIEKVQKELFSENDDCRAHAVISVGVLGMKKNRTINVLLDLLELDPCEYVRLQVTRTLAALRATHSKVIHALRERERAEGPLAREATKALRVLVMSASKNTSRASTKTRKMRDVSSSLAHSHSPTHRRETVG